MDQCAPTRRGHPGEASAVGGIEMGRRRITRRGFLEVAGAAALGVAGAGVPSVVRAQAPARVVFWHAMGGNLGETVVRAFVNTFNASRKDIQVEAQFQGTYDDLINKLRASLQSSAVPALAQVYDIGTRFMIDSRGIAPMQEFIDRDRFDLTAFEPNILAYYRVGNRLYSMPFNTSTAILYYNKDMYKQAGLNPGRPPRTFEEIEAYAKRLVESGTTRSGITLSIYGWFFEQLLARQADGGGLPSGSGRSPHRGLVGRDGEGRDRFESGPLSPRERRGAARICRRPDGDDLRIDRDAPEPPLPVGRPVRGGHRVFPEAPRGQRRRQHRWGSLGVDLEEPAAGRAAGRVGVREVHHGAGAAGRLACRDRVLSDPEGRVPRADRAGDARQEPAVPDRGQ
ncbi:MAG: extracellular solute-binding protein [Bacillati bacterium ANGP1]|uniref:Extracellular solute-binding protein n=1 Tax=Candidatus Segetimicrobium genomatis TaxID=2569760 RepID=A0A537JNY2_9BACT|nr:MAG: extracellular solute-binding protein [Terrabacteria group bacterium ANGP1]